MAVTKNAKADRVNRPVASVLVVAAATVVIFAILAFWDTYDGPNAERASAGAAATQIAAFCGWTFHEPAAAPIRCRVDDLEEVAEGDWRVRLERPQVRTWFAASPVP